MSKLEDSTARVKVRVSRSSNSEENFSTLFLSKLFINLNFHFSQRRLGII